MSDAHPEIEILLTDFKMPGSMEGARLAHHVRGRWPPVKIIFGTGKVHTQLCDLPNRSQFVPKPFQHDDLWSDLKHAVGEGWSHPSDGKAA